MKNPQGMVDSLDLEILDYLEKDGRISFKTISDNIKKTEATIRRRVKKMMDDGVIKRFSVLIDEKKINNPTKATIKISPDLSKIKEITSKLKEIEEITDIWRLSGDCGLFIKVEIPSLEEINPLVEDRISKIPGVEIREICFITREVKSKFG